MAYRDYSGAAPTFAEAHAHASREEEDIGFYDADTAQKPYEQYTREDLEREAADEYDHPVGDFIGQRKVKGSSDAYGGMRQSKSTARHQDEEEEDDLGAPPPHDGYYYGESAQRNPFADSQPTARKATAAGYDPKDRNFIHPHDVPAYGVQNFYNRAMLTGFQIGSFIGTTLAFNLIIVMAIVWFITRKLNPFYKHPPVAEVDKTWERRITGERYSLRAEYYANFFGYDCEDVDVETEDGFVLRVHHLSSKKHKVVGHPVILQHGILSTGTTFMVNEERSLAFWLLEQGYDVWVSNIRTNHKMPHRSYPRTDPRYWAWAIKEIGMYDLPAIVDFVSARTGKKPAYVGHSQGTGTMFLALSRGMRPDIGNKLSCFVALGPSVYGGPVLRRFPFSLTRMFKNRKIWSLLFGVREFIPIIGLLQQYIPGWLFGHVGVPIFAFIFKFHCHNWLNRQVPKYFRTVAVPNSSELLYYYMSNLSYNNCIFDTAITEPWFPRSFPPLAIIYGTSDTLVLGKPLVERIRAHEENVRLVKVVALDGYEHLDMLWGVSALEDCYGSIREVIDATKDGYPELEPLRDEKRGPGRRSSIGKSKARPYKEYA